VSRWALVDRRQTPLSRSPNKCCRFNEMATQADVAAAKCRHMPSPPNDKGQEFYEGFYDDESWVVAWRKLAKVLLATSARTEQLFSWNRGSFPSIPWPHPRWRETHHWDRPAWKLRRSKLSPPCGWGANARWPSRTRTDHPLARGGSRCTLCRSSRCSDAKCQKWPWALAVWVDTPWGS